MYPARSNLVQLVSPAPKRYFQRLISAAGCQTGLDIGCGGGSLLTSVRGDHFRSTGIDADPAAIDASRSSGVHDDYICADFMAYEFKERFDVVVMSHVLEHFPRDAGMDVIRRVESLARVLLYIETPFGFVEQFAVGGNPYQRHLSGWFPEDFQGRGYTVFGSGPRVLRVRPTDRKYLPQVVRRTLTRAAQWFIFRRPQIADAISGIRYVDQEGNLRRV